MEELIKEIIKYESEAIKNISNLSEEEKISKFKEIILLLKNKNVDINAQNGNGETLLMKIAQTNPIFYHKLKDFLINEGINPELKDQYGNTAEDYINKTQ